MKKKYTIIIILSLCVLFCLLGCQKKEQSAASKIGEGVGQIIDEKVGNQNNSMSKIGNAVGETINQKGSDDSVNDLAKVIDNELRKNLSDEDYRYYENYSAELKDEFNKKVDETVDEFKNLFNDIFK